MSKPALRRRDGDIIDGAEFHWSPVEFTHGPGSLNICVTPTGILIGGIYDDPDNDNPNVKDGDMVGNGEIEFTIDELVALLSKK
jgi:hypothetical protein